MELKQAEQHILSDVFPSAATFPGLSDHSWKKQTFKAGDTLFKPGQPSNRFVLLGQGTIRVQLQNDQERNLLLYRIEPGQLCIHSLINLIMMKISAISLLRKLMDGCAGRKRSSFINGWTVPVSFSTGYSTILVPASNRL
ncbi:cyclic nucleotide-binding domain-containing protein [Solemya elarraichensis gill symbiont]|uniref:cyclic nucleotide-binding domain-containing protein n=1 Tax=Solemya elarraichensis gill symbiont TaxID=1918949 RepID=UPI0010847B63